MKAAVGGNSPRFDQVLGEPEKAGIILCPFVIFWRRGWAKQQKTNASSKGT